jgi:hypothetical protein
MGEPWTTGELDALRRNASSQACAGTFDLNALAKLHGRPPLDVNRALDALLGRAPADALAWLNGAGGGRRQPLTATVPPAVKRFLRGMFGE